MEGKARHCTKAWGTPYYVAVTKHLYDIQALQLSPFQFTLCRRISATHHLSSRVLRASSQQADMLHPTMLLLLFWQQDTGTGTQAEGHRCPSTCKEMHLSARKSWAAANTEIQEAWM